MKWKYLIIGDYMLGGTDEWDVAQHYSNKEELVIDASTGEKLVTSADQFTYRSNIGRITTPAEVYEERERNNRA